MSEPTPRERKRFVKLLHLGQYLWRNNRGEWGSQLLERKHAEDLLLNSGECPPRKTWTAANSPFADDAHETEWCVPIHGRDLAPDAPLFIERGRELYLNLWLPPTLVPKPGPWPRIEQILRWLSDHDTAGYEWLRNWLAFKLQHPGELPGTAVLLVGTPGSGKNTLFQIMEHALGESNCATITDETLSKTYNTTYADKLFVLGNELGTESSRSQSLYTRTLSWITEKRIEIEGKGKDRYVTTNRAGWLFATNNPGKVLGIAKDDRRYTVFNNFDLVKGTEYALMLKGLYDPKTNTFVESFVEEIAGFVHELRARQIDHDLVRSPFSNEARRSLIQISESSVEAFVREMHEAHDPTAFLQQMSPALSGGANSVLVKNRLGAYTSAGLYGCYTTFCHREGLSHPSSRRSFTTYLVKVARWRPDNIKGAGRCLISPAGQSATAAPLEGETSGTITLIATARPSSSQPVTATDRKSVV